MRQDSTQTVAAAAAAAANRSKINSQAIAVQPNGLSTHRIRLSP